MEWSLNEYEKLVIHMNTPRVAIDNAVCATATLVKVDSARHRGILLEVVQVLSDLNLSIRKAYISSDGSWFMDVFHVTDQYGHKLTDETVISYIQQSVGTGDASRSDGSNGLTTLELTGTDRPGLLSEVFAVLADLQCSVVDAKVWTHSGRVASLIFVKDADSGSPIDQDSNRIHQINSRLRNVLKGDHEDRGAKAVLSFTGAANADRRLHQIMSADRDYERTSSSPSRPFVSVQNWLERGYSVVNVQCRDRLKLLFDVLCTLTDMEYVVFHGTIDTDGDRAYQEFYIRHSDGGPICSEPERQRVIQCLQAAIERRASEGLRLELCTEDRQGLLADVTRTFRENGLSVRRAEASTQGEVARNVFYVTDAAAGYEADFKTVDAVIEKIGVGSLKVVEERLPRNKRSATDKADGGGGVGLFYLGSIVKRNLYNLGLIKSCS